MEAEWRSELGAWLTPFAAALRNKTRRRMCPAYIAGMIGPGDRKGAQPMAARDDEVGYDRLHHSIGCGVWDEAPLELALLAEADRQIEGEKAWLIVDDTALPKKGRHSFGMAPQYASTLGENANCQTSGVADARVGRSAGLGGLAPVPAGELDERCGPSGSCARPEASRPYRTKPEIALAEIDRIREAGVRFGCVLADARSGISPASGKA